MKASLLLGPDADRSDEWYKRRRDGITASEIAVLIGISPFESPFSLYWRKKGVLADEPDNDTLSLGRHLEPWIAGKFEQAHPQFILGLAGLWASADRPWQLCTPDRLVYECGQCTCEHGQAMPGPCDDCSGHHSAPVALWEGKTSATYDGWGEDGTDEIPAYYAAQVQWQLDVMGLNAAHVSCLFLQSKRTRHYVISRDEDDIVFMRRQAGSFLDLLAEDIPPPIDSHQATTGALKQLHPQLEDRDAEILIDLADEYATACRLYKDAQALKDQLTNELRAAMGDAARAVSNGDKIATRSVYETRRIDVDRLRRERPDVAAEYTVVSTTDKIIPRRGT